jgi:transketolase
MGAYVLQDASSGDPRAIILATGSEVHLAVEARAALEVEGIPTRVVSMPSWRLFAEQEQEYRDSVLPPGVKARVSVEAGLTGGWERWIGEEGSAVGLDHFGASAPSETLFEEYGITSERIAAEVRRILASEGT